MLQGSIVFDMFVLQMTEFVVFDTWGNTIDAVYLQPAGTAMRATMGTGNIPISSTNLMWTVSSTSNSQIGHALVVQLPQNYTTGGLISIQVVYQTAAGGVGANFLSGTQTQDGNNFFFTYSYMINGRSFAPQQDTPSNRITWGGCILADPSYTVLMSGNMTGTYYGAMGMVKRCFYNQIPTANVFMAAVAGVMDYTSTGDNTGFWAEPSMVSSAATDFADLQAFRDTVEYYV